MRTLAISCMAALWFAGAATLSLAAPVELFVSPAGRDTHVGTKDQPLATLQGARDAIRALKRKGPLPPGGITVTLAAGTYRFDKTLELTYEDSGTAQAPIVYRAAPGSPRTAEPSPQTQPEGPGVRLLGGLIVDNFVPITDKAILNQLDPSVRDRVVQCDLRHAGVSDLGQLTARGAGRPSQPAHLEVFCGGQPMQLARWPNEDFAHITGLPGRNSDKTPSSEMGDLKAGFLFTNSRPRNWRSPADVWIYGYWAREWAGSYERIESYDPQTGLIKTAAPYGQYGFRAKQRVVFLNVLEELDQPGEYFVNRSAGMLYFYPPPVFASGAQPETMVSVLAGPMISMRDVSFVSFDGRGAGMSLECTRGHGIVIVGGQECRFEHLTLRNIGNWAVRIESGQRHQVIGCDIRQTGDGGVYASGGDRKTLSPGGHRIEDSRLTDIARWNKCYCPAVQLEGVGNVLAHCEIARHPHAGVIFYGNEHRIEYNVIHHTCLETGDVGAVYIGRDWTMRGNLIRYNFFHDIGGPAPFDIAHGAQAVYLDDQASGATVAHNIFLNVQRAIFIGGGRDNTVENNLFMNCAQGVAIDGRGLDRSLMWKTSTDVDMRKKLEAMNSDRPPYATRYPDLAKIAAYLKADETGGKGVPPEGNAVQRNLFVGSGKWLDISWNATPAIIAIQGNTVAQTPAAAGFANPTDPVKDMFRLQADAAAFKAGFIPIPLESIGPASGSRSATLDR